MSLKNVRMIPSVSGSPLGWFPRSRPISTSVEAYVHISSYKHHEVYEVDFGGSPCISFPKNCFISVSSLSETAALSSTGGVSIMERR